MSRIGKKPLEIPNGLEINLAEGRLTISGKSGKLELSVHPKVFVELVEEDGKKILKFSVTDPEDKKQRALWGLYRRLAENMVLGLLNPYTKQLEMIGVGFKANVTGQTIILDVGFSHPVELKLPSGVSAKIEKNIITLQGIDKYLVGEVAAAIRRVRKPEPYKGKGIRYVGEVVRKKAGKAATKTAA